MASMVPEVPVDHHNLRNRYTKCDIKVCVIVEVSSAVLLTLKVLVATIDAQWEGMGDVGSARYELALLPPCPTIRVLSYSS